MCLIGAHISTSGGLHKAFARADKIGCEAMQIFSKSQLRWQAKPLDEQELNAWAFAARKSKVREVVCHASYLINLASDGELLEKSKLSLAEELQRSEQLGISKIVLHPGSRGDRDLKTALRNISDALLEVFDKSETAKCKILLETMAGQGSSLGRKLEEFAQILEYAKGNERIAFCVDTCHIFAAGYDISQEDGYEKFILEIAKNIGLERVEGWHLNDSKKPCASHIDRHEHLGAGQLGLTPFRMIMNDRRFENIPALLETPKDDDGDIKNLTILRNFRINTLKSV